MERRHVRLKVLPAGKEGMDPVPPLAEEEVREVGAEVEHARASSLNVLSPPEVNEAPHIWSLHSRIRISRF